MTRFFSKKSFIHPSLSLLYAEEEVDLLAPLRFEAINRCVLLYVCMYVRTPDWSTPLGRSQGGWNGFAFFLSKFEMGRWNIGILGKESIWTYNSMWSIVSRQ